MQWYQEIGELICAQDKPWFAKVLQTALQSVIDYDYFLMVLYRKNQPINLIRYDFPDAQIEQALARFSQKTYRADPIYRLQAQDQITSGLYDMADLARRCPPLSASDRQSLHDLVDDADEEIGFRTKGWPEYLQESCIIVKRDAQNTIAISLYNCGLDKENDMGANQLATIFPALSAILLRVPLPILSPNPNKNEVAISAHPADMSAKVAAFFEQELAVSLTPRETELFAHLLQGQTISAIADELCISIHTAKTHRRNVYRRIGHGRQLELVRKFHLYLSTPS